jgi:hypothetical protein
LLTHPAITFSTSAGSIPVLAISSEYVRPRSVAG